MPRYKLTIEYDGTDFCGWQRQDIPNSVQQVLEEAIERFCGQEVRLHTAGRTDAGVHALGQVAHVDLPRDYTDLEVRNAITVHARPHKVVIIDAQRVHDEFHARFDAVKRYYRYIICNRRADMAIGSDYAWHVFHQLDLEKMQCAANVLLGHHDFTSFRAVDCQAKSPMRSIDTIHVSKTHDMVHIDVSAPSFLHHQVRNIVGTLKKIGEGRWEEERMPEILAAKDRAAAGPTAPPHGLYFMRVDYKDSGSK
jgi:tRNA pseudouridine38-40 synthase